MTAGPFHKTCNCRCLPPFPCIEGCANSGHFTYETILVNMVSPTYSYTTASSTFTYIEGTATVNVYNPDVTAIGPSKALYRRPSSAAWGFGMKQGSSVCQWLWNNPLVVQTVLLSPNFCSCTGAAPCVDASVTTPTPYTPVNAIDATSPWDRVILANPSYLCGVCYCPGCGSISANPRGHYQCSDINYWSSGVLHIIEGGVPGGTPPYTYDTTHYNPFGSGYWYWLFEWKAYGGNSWTYNRIQHPNYPFEGYSEMHNAGYSQAAFYGNTVGGILQDDRHEAVVILQYAKVINCSTDFLGTPITLPFHKYIDPTNELTYVMSTYPSSVTLELTPV